MTSRQELPSCITTFDGHCIELIHTYAAAHTSFSQPKLVILLHGIFTDREEKGRFNRLTERLNNSGFDVLRFDFRGHGHSPLPSTSFTVGGAMVDYLAVCQEANKHYDSIACVASSFSASIAVLERNMDDPIKLTRLVLFNPVISYYDTFVQPILDWGREIFSISAKHQLLTQGISEVVDGFAVSLFLYIDFHNIHPETANILHVPTIIFHGDLDDKVPLTVAKEFSRRVKCEFNLVHGAGHAFKDEVLEAQVHRQTIEFLSSK